MKNYDQHSEDYRTVERAIHWLTQRAEEQPTLGELSEALSLSPAHVQRVFKRWAGVSPKQFLEYITVRHARAWLKRSQSVLDTSLNVGLSGPGRLHDHMVQVDAVSPGEFKRLGEGLQIRYGVHSSPFGDCMIGLTDRGVCHLSFVKEGGTSASIDELRALWPNAVCIEAGEEISQICELIFTPVSTSSHESLRLFLCGTNFQVKVWEALLRIPIGEVISYGALAKRLGRPSAGRAVGTAVGANPVAYLIPCHRVIKASGVLHNYRWGAVRKQAMLGWEQSRAS